MARLPVRAMNLAHAGHRWLEAGLEVVDGRAGGGRDATQEEEASMSQGRYGVLVVQLTASRGLGGVRGVVRVLDDGNRGLFCNAMLVVRVLVLMLMMFELKLVVLESVKSEE